MKTQQLFRHAPWLVVLLIGGIAIAQSADEGRVFPYVGYLEEDGFPVEGLRVVRVNLFESEGAGTACQTYTFSDVSVASGRFQVELTDVPDSCLIDGELFADVAVGGTVGTLVDLSTGVGSGRVRVGAVPFAAASPKAATLLVEEGLEVKGSAVIDGAVDVGGNLDVVGDLTADSVDSLGPVFWSNSSLTGDSGGSMELGNSGTPYIDFHNKTTGDYDARLILTGNDAVQLNGASFAVTNGNLSASGTVTGQGIWEKVAEFTWNGSGNYNVSGLNGNAARRYRIHIQGYIQGSGANRTIGVRPNGDSNANNYSAFMQHWNGHEAGVQFHDSTNVTGVPAYTFLPIATNHWSSDGFFQATAEMNSHSNQFRMIRSEDVYHRGDRQTDMIQTTHAAAWKNNSTNITSLTFHANSANLSNALVTIYRMR
jgi:hypothetical protein